MFRNFFIHHNFPEFLQPLWDLRVQRVSSFYRGFLFVSFWGFIGLGFIRFPWSNTNRSWEMSLLFPSFLSRIWISVSVGEEDQDEEDEEEWLSCFIGVFEVDEDPEDDDKPGTTIGTKFSVLQDIRIPYLMRCGCLTIDPFVGIPVFIAKLSERWHCWRVIEDFHSQEYIQLFDIHNCLFMRLHFSIGGYDYRRTARFRESIHFTITQVFCWSCALTRSRQQILFPQVSTLMQVGTFFPKVRRMLLFSGPSILVHFWKASTLLRGHLTLATLSLRVNDPQILGRWCYAHEAHLGKYIRAKDFGLEF